MNPAVNSFNLMFLGCDPDTRALLEPLAAPLRIRFNDALNSGDGLVMLARQKIDVVLLALPLAQGDGLQLLETIVGLDPAAAVMVLVDTVSVETAVEIMKRGACELFTRPVDQKRMAAALARAIDRAHRYRKEPVILTELEHERFGAIADSLPYGLLVCDAEGRVLFFNCAFERLLGITPPPDRGRPLACYIDDERFNRMVAALLQGKTDGRAENLALELCLTDNRVLSVRARALAGDLRNGNTGAVVTFMDVTELKMVERLKSEFVSRVSHELRSPLSTIHEQLELVLNDTTGVLPDSDQNLLARAQEKTRGLIDMIGDLLDLSRIEAGTACDVAAVEDLTDTLEKVVGFLHTRAARKQQLLELKRDGGVVPVRADLSALESIFSNLITNAINYTQDGGQIRVGVSCDGQWARVRVADTGPGIAKRHQEKIFERFYRIRNDQTRHITGTGLGLPIIKGLIESLDGRIEVESTPGRGTVFSVTLPLAE